MTPEDVDRAIIQKEDDGPEQDAMSVDERKCDKGPEDITSGGAVMQRQDDGP